MKEKERRDIFINLDTTGAEKELEKLKKKIAATGKEISDLLQKKELAWKQEISTEEKLNEEKQVLIEMRKQLRELQTAAKDSSISVGGRENAELLIPEAEGKIEEQQERVAMLQENYEDIWAKTEKYNESLEKAKKSLREQQEQAGELEWQIAKANAGMESSSKKIEEPKKNISNQIKQSLSSGLKNIGKNNVFSKIANEVGKNLVSNIAKVGIGYFGGIISKYLNANTQFTNALEQLKASLQTAFQPILDVAIPALITLINVIARVINVVAQFIGALFGKTVKQASGSTKALNEETKALESTGVAADKAAGSLASFDEINTIQTENKSGGGGGSSVGIATPDISAFGEFNSEEYIAKIDELTAYISGALLGLGALLTFSGVNIPLGLSLMAVGALGLAAVVAENWDSVNNSVKEAVNRTLVLLGTAMMAIGAVLVFSSANIPLGIGLMAVGAVSLATEVALNWDTIVTAMEGPIGDITALVSGALLMVGAILTLSCADLKLGIALMAAGAIGLASYAVINWNEIATALQGSLGEIVAIVSAELLGLGAILAFSSANVPLGIGLMAAGAAGLAGIVALNWETLIAALQGPVGIVTALVSTALLAIGAILLFSGANAPLGLGLLAAGGVGLAAAISPNWEFLSEKFKEIWGSVQRVLSDIWEGIKNVFSGIWDFIKGFINNVIGGIESFVNLFIEGINLLISGLNALGSVGGLIGLGFYIQPLGRVAIPRLATGAVIPPNREFLAVLGDQKSGTNVEAPLSTIEQALQNVWDRNGGAGGDLHVTLQLDGKTVARNTVKHINDMTRAAGRPVLVI